MVANDGPVQHVNGTAQKVQRKPSGRRSHFDPVKFKARFDAYVIEHLGTNKQEAEKILVPYHEMRQMQRNNDAIIMRMQKKQKESECDEKEAAKVLNEVLKLREKNSQLELNFYKKLAKTVSAKKILHFQAIEKYYFMHEMKRLSK